MSHLDQDKLLGDIARRKVVALYEPNLPPFYRSGSSAKSSHFLELFAGQRRNRMGDISTFIERSSRIG